MWTISQTGDEKPKRSIFNLDRDEMKHKASTDKVDAEIKLLNNKKAQLEQKLSSTDNPDLQLQLAQIDNELRQKNNDAYRRQHTKFSTGVDITI